MSKIPRFTADQESELGALERELATGTLTGERLRQGIGRIASADSPSAIRSGMQDLLYLQTARSNPNSQVIGMMLIEDGTPSEGALNADDWPYQSAVEAMRDGWRVISFPNMALMALDHDDAHGLEFEFILERWR